MKVANIVNANNQEIFSKYLSEISKFKPLSREEELELFKKLEITNDQAIIEKLCKHNLLFVVSVAKPYAKFLVSSSLTLEDLVNEGNIGLYLSIKKFDYRTGNKFISYAVWLIRAYILLTIQTNVKSIRLPNNIRGVYTKFLKQESILEQKLGYNPTSIEVFEVMFEENQMTEKDSVDYLNEVIKMNQSEISLNIPAYDDGLDELSSTISSNEINVDEMLINKERKQLIIKLLDRTPENIKNYIYDYFGVLDNKPMKLKDIGNKYGVNSITVKQRITRHLRVIRNRNREKETFFFPSNDKKWIY